MDREDKRKQLLIDYMTAFGTEGGKRVLDNLSKECYEHNVTFVRGESDSTAFNEGKRYVMLHIRRILAKDPHEKRQTEGK